MGLETGTFLNDLVATNPDGAVDKKFQGDDHIRLIKQVLRNTFPGLGGRAFRVQTKVGNYGPTIATDNMSLLYFSAVATLTLGGAAALGNGHIQFVFAGNGIVTVTPSGTDTVNGLAGLSLPTGKMAVLISNGVDGFVAMIESPPIAPSLSRIGDIASQSILGRVTAGAGITEVLTPAQVLTLLGLTKVNSVLNVNTGTVGNIGPGPDDLMTYVLPANSLSAVGKGIRITASGHVANTVDTKSVFFYFGAANNGFFTSASSISRWRLDATVISTGVNTQDIHMTFLEAPSGGTVAASKAAIVDATPATEITSGAITVKLQGSNTTNNNDVVQELMIVESING